MITKADDKQKPQARLFDIQTKEVSLVDRAANRRRFLLAKKDDGMSKKLQADGRGGFVEVEVEKSDAEGTASATETTTDTNTSDDTATTEKDADGAGEVTETKADTETTETTDGPSEEVAKCVSMLGATAERVIAVAKSIVAGEQIPEAFDDEIASMVGEAMKSARMTPSRKDRFSKALEELQKILGELAGAASDEAKDETKKSDDALAALQAEVTKLTATVTKQADTIRQLETQPAGSNALPVERSEGDGQKDTTFWPLDMNNEHKVDKAHAQERGVSFFDD